MVETAQHKWRHQFLFVCFQQNESKMVIINIPYHTSNFSDKTELWVFLERLIIIFFLLFIGAGILAYFLSTYITKSTSCGKSKN